MRVVPVLDLLNGVVVRGIGGRRESYRPIESRLVPGSDPLSIASAFRDQLGLTTLYVADLDAIVRGEPGWETYRQLAGAEFELLIDAGVNSPEVARRILDSGAKRVVVGLESCASPETLEKIVAEVAPGRVIFSLDLKRGQPLVAPGCWIGWEPLSIARVVLNAGVDGLIILDLAGVGVGEGIQTADLCQSILQEFPDTRLITGGGVRHRLDLVQEAATGVAGVLVASALHDGRLTAADLASYSTGWPGTVVPKTRST
ncbi:MAG: HisA/HisF-related TIM barrel protein [Planctomycetota bacterium]|nr:HisA/HisF-related TIM barrel protein [Planctomycetota bacterium]